LVVTYLIFTTALLLIGISLSQQVNASLFPIIKANLTPSQQFGGNFYVMKNVMVTNTTSNNNNNNDNNKVSYSLDSGGPDPIILLDFRSGDLTFTGKLLVHNGTNTQFVNIQILASGTNVNTDTKTGNKITVIGGPMSEVVLDSNTPVFLKGNATLSSNPSQSALILEAVSTL
jgi:hypothetical protein